MNTVLSIFSSIISHVFVYCLNSSKVITGVNKFSPLETHWQVALQGKCRLGWHIAGIKTALPLQVNSHFQDLRNYPRGLFFRLNKETKTSANGIFWLHWSMENVLTLYFKELYLVFTFFPSIFMGFKPVFWALKVLGVRTIAPMLPKCRRQPSRYHKLWVPWSDCT